MAARFTVLASGSAGNASLLEVDGFGLLIDCGLHPRTLSARLTAVGATWDRVHAAVLTHTHGDHWKDLTLARFRTGRIPIYGHEGQLAHLNVAAPSFTGLHRAKLVRAYSEGQPLTLAPGLVCKPVRVPHDSEPTFGFRLEYRDGDGSEPAWSLGYASDVGRPCEALAGAFAGVDVLALEYNHDERMQRASGRPAFLIERVLGDGGHLSNGQAADLTRRIASDSGPTTPWCLVQLHLSRECNSPALALEAGRGAFAALRRPAVVVTASQHAPSRSIPLERRVECGANPPSAWAQASPAGKAIQPPLPGFDRPFD